MPLAFREISTKTAAFLPCPQQCAQVFCHQKKQKGLDVGSRLGTSELLCAVNFQALCLLAVCSRSSLAAPLRIQRALGSGSGTPGAWLSTDRCARPTGAQHPDLQRAQGLVRVHIHTLLFALPWPCKASLALPSVWGEGLIAANLILCETCPVLLIL